MKHSKELYNHENRIIVDELIMLYKGKYCNIRQFLQNKPVCFGTKVWVACSSKSHYVTNLQVYMGARTQMEKEGMRYSIVTSLLSDYKGR